MKIPLYYPGDDILYSFGGIQYPVKVIRIYRGISWYDETTNPNADWFLEAEYIGIPGKDTLKCMQETTNVKYYELTLISRGSYGSRNILKHSMI